MAVYHYTHALGSEVKKGSPEEIHVLSNRSTCYVKLGRPREAVTDAQLIIDRQPEAARSYYLRGVRRDAEFERP